MNAIHEFINRFKMMVGDDLSAEGLQLHQIALRTTVIYLFGIALVRAGKSRLIGRSSPLDVLIGIMLGALLGGAIIGRSSTTNAMASALVLVSLHWIFTAIASRCHFFGNLLKGKAKVIFADGKMVERNMRSSHLSEHDLMEALRVQANMDRLSDVKIAFKERNGEISIVKNEGK